MSPRALVSSLAVTLTLVFGTSHAAPTAGDTSTENGAESDVPRAAPAARGAESRTVDLLIELQPRSAGLEFNERARPSSVDRSNRVVPERAASQPEASRAGLFGAGATPPVTARRASSDPDQDYKVHTGGVNVNSDAPRGGSSGSGVIEEPGAGIARRAISFVRENREWVVGGGILVLALMWGASFAAGRGGRR